MRGGVFVLLPPMKLKLVRLTRGGVVVGIGLVDENGVALPSQKNGLLKTSFEAGPTFTAEFAINDSDFTLALDEFVELPRPGSWRGRSA
jgi:hypothetical protein